LPVAKQTPKLRAAALAVSPADDEYVRAPVAEITRNSVPNDSALTGDAVFALRVKGDTMVANGEGPSFPPGSTIIVDLAVDPKPRDFVLAQRAGGACFGLLLHHGEERSLKMLNPLYEPQSLAANDEIVGVVTGVQVSRLRR
jgi:SOS-response transcriptional repressor LexA